MMKEASMGIHVTRDRVSTKISIHLVYEEKPFILHTLSEAASQN